MTLGTLNALTPFTIDMYLPSFPDIARDLHVNVSQMALTVSIYFIGFALGQILYGPLLDRFGRKPPLYFGLAIYILTSLGCAFSTSLPMLLGFRFASALGGSAATVAAVAMVRDFFPVHEATKVFSLLMLVLSASPLLAPTVGSFVISVASWRTIFLILMGFGAFDLLLTFFVLPRKHVGDASVDLRLGPILTSFKNVFKNRQFATYTLTGSFSFAGLFVYVAGSPAIFMDGFQVNARVYGMIFAFLACGMIGGGQLNLLLIKKFSERQIIRVAVFLQVILGIFFVSLVAANLCGLAETVGFLFVILICAGIVYPNAAALALQPFTKNVGSASSLLGFLQLGIGALTSAGVGLLEARGSFPTALVICVSSIIALLILIFNQRPRKA